MHVNEQLALARTLEELWTGLMPTLEAPGLEQFLLWLGIHPEERITFGINRAARKVGKMREAGTPMSTLDTVRYAASVMNNEQKGWRKFDSLPRAAMKPSEREIDGNR